MTDRNEIEEIRIDRESERAQLLKMDPRGRITIPSSLRSRHGIDPEDDNEIWVDISINSIEIRDGGDE